MTRILISGYYGYNNLGDEAILAATAAMFRIQAPDIELVAMSADPEATTRLHGVKAIPRWGVGALWQGLRESDLFLLGGGGLLQDVTSWRSPLYYSGQLLAARAAGTPAMLWAQGIGPLEGSLIRTAVGQAIRQVRAATVRDADSVTELGRLGLPADRVSLTADPVLVLAPSQPARAESIIAQCGLEPRRPFIAVAIRPWKTWFERQLKSFTAVLAQLATQNGLQILLVPFQLSVDRFLAEETAYCLGTRPAGNAPRVAVMSQPVNAQDMMAVLGKAQFVIGMRLHSLIMAAAQGVPAIGIVYDPKVAAFSQLAGYPVMDSVTALTEAEAWQKGLFDAWYSQQEQRRYLGQRLPELQQAAWRNTDVALRLLGR